MNNVDALRSRIRLSEIDFRWLIIPALLCIWMLPFITFSPPDDWRVSRFGTAPILPPIVMKAMKFFGRGGAIALLGFYLLTLWDHEKRPQAIGFMSPFLAFGCFGVLSTMWSALKSISIQQSVTFCMILMLASYVAILWRNDRTSELLVKHLSLAILCLSILLIALALGMPRSGALTREASGILHSTNAGATGGLGIVLTLSARLLWRSRWSSFWLPIVATELTMMVIGGNRLSVAITGITVIFLLALSLHRGVAAALLLCGSLLFTSYVVADPGLSMVSSLGKDVGVYAKQGQTSAQLSSLSGRAEMWEKMWKSFTESPIIGHGYFVTTERGRIYVWQEWGNWTAHNVVLQTLTTTGVIGLSLLVIGFASLTVGIYFGSLRLSGIEPSVTLLLVFATWYAGWGFLNSSFIGPLTPESVVFACMLGIAAGIGSSARLELVKEHSLLQPDAGTAKSEPTPTTHAGVEPKWDNSI
ncbi:MAG: O-antigen ligase family protein [Aureliella sp.]